MKKLRAEISRLEDENAQLRFARISLGGCYHQYKKNGQRHKLCDECERIENESFKSFRVKL